MSREKLRQIEGKIDEYVGAKLAELRVQGGRSQEKFAALLFLSQNTIFRHENGEVRISAGRLLILSRILGVDVSTFFEDVPEDLLTLPD